MTNPIPKHSRYVIVENLRYFLSAFKTTDALWFGHKFKVIVKKGYFSGGAGEIISTIISTQK